MTDGGGSTADVQAELQEYLNAKDINGLFIQIVEQLLIQKPDNPIGFIVEYLVKRHPDKTRAMSLGVAAAAAPLSAAAAATASATDRRLSGAATAKERKSSALMTPADFVGHILSDEESDSEAEDDYVDDVQLKPSLSSTVVGGRRVSVCAELVDPNAKQAEPSKYPKSKQEANRILDILSENLMFKHLDPGSTERVMEAMFNVRKEPGDCIIKEGEEGDNFYVIDEGTIDVYIKKEGKEIKVKSMGVGESFGELALMYSTPRTATCKAATSLRLWALDRISFKLILMQTTTSRRKQYKTFLDRVPILHELTEYEVLTVADSLVEEVVEDGHVICEQGDVGEAFYIIKDGTVVCRQTDATGEVVEVARLGEGHYFGELALMTSKARQATVTAVGQTTLLSMDRKTFKRILGRMEDILQRNMESYRKIQAQAI
ncbi:cyclic nucleotide-binding-like protein [Tribonema minus]|uniref:Cyclic nucleotide-binding-like protein n=1 Tax=Tribonema minus TaxID=303371 RepID=A0A835YU11_9STRA|nr:cyclic nucleotide-binding-like protein [Tribonema minus]